MKEISIKKFYVILCFACALICYFIILYLLTGLSRQIYKVDISQFKGRVLPDYAIQSGTFAIATPFLKALTFGEDAILSYGEHGIEIWKPDPTTSGAFLKAGMYVDNRSCYYEVTINNNEIILSEKIKIGTYVVSFLSSIVATFFIFFFTTTIVKTINKKRNRNNKTLLNSC